MDNTEILEVVEKLNSILEDTYKGNSVEFLEFISNGKDTIIKFLGETIWSSVEDLREFIEEKDKFEDLEYYLKLQCNKKIANLELQKFTRTTD